MSNRVRCPFCLSINTAEGICGGGARPPFFFHVCDDCDTSWSTDKKHEWYHAPAVVPKKAEAKP